MTIYVVDMEWTLMPARKPMEKDFACLFLQTEQILTA